MLIVTGSAEVRSDQLEAALALCRQHVDRSRAEPGCLEHGVYQDGDDKLVADWLDKHLPAKKSAEK